MYCILPCSPHCFRIILDYGWLWCQGKAQPRGLGMPWSFSRFTQGNHLSTAWTLADSPDPLSVHSLIHPFGYPPANSLDPLSVHSMIHPFGYPPRGLVTDFATFCKNTASTPAATAPQGWGDWNHEYGPIGQITQTAAESQKMVAARPPYFLQHRV